MNLPLESISAVRLTSTGWRRIILFQSVRQFISSVISILIGLSLVAVLGIFLFPKMDVDTGLIVVVVGSALVGPLLILIGALPATFSIKGKNNLKNISEWLDKQLRWMGYRKEDISSTTYVHMFPRWQRWDENSISFTASEQTIVVRGPVFILNKLHKMLGQQSEISEAWQR